MTSVTIIGAERECQCDECGKALKVGVRTDVLGVVGADCFVAAIQSDRKRFSRGKPDAAYVRTLAKMRQGDNWEQLGRMGYGPRHFVFPLNATSAGA